MVAFADNSPLLSLLLAFLSLGSFFLVWWSLLLPRLPLILLAATLVIGQALRLPLPGQGGGLLVSDLAVILVLLTAVVVTLIRQPQLSRPLSLFLKFWTGLLGIFLLWATITLATGIVYLELTLPSAFIAASYLARLAAHLLLFPALALLLDGPRDHEFAGKLFITTTFVLLVLGFLQLLLLPDFSPLTAAGWDPHRWRLTSTWLDPNFFAAYLFIATPLAALIIKNRYLAVTLAGVGSFALLATQSRGGLLAATLSGSLLAPLLVLKLPSIPTIRRYLPLTITILMSAFVIVLSLLWPRLTSLLLDDPTATLRWQALTGIQERMLPLYGSFGSGYNTYQFAAAEVGLGHNFSQHSRAGTDNSFLTIWITTGLPGLLLFSSLSLALAAFLLFHWVKHRNHLAFATLFALLALTFHSQIINSFLYSHLLIVLAWAFALAVHRPHLETPPL